MVFSITKISQTLFVMPQFIPFHFINQVSFGYLSLIIIIYVFSKWILPNFPLVALARVVALHPHKKFNTPPIASFISFFISKRSYSTLSLYHQITVFNYSFH